MSGVTLISRRMGSNTRISAFEVTIKFNVSLAGLKPTRAASAVLINDNFSLIFFFLDSVLFFEIIFAISSYFLSIRLSRYSIKSYAQALILPAVARRVELESVPA